MLYRIESSKSMDEIERVLRESAARHQFGVIAVHDLKETLAKKGVDLAMECRIYEVCNPHQAKKVLDADGAISTALPCRISVYGSAKQYTLATTHPALKPQRFLRQIVRAVLPLGIGIIYDPFAGSGCTLAAAEALGLKSVGTDRDPEYCDMAGSAFPKLAAFIVRERDEGK